MCFNFKRSGKTENTTRRKSNYEYLEFMEQQAEIGAQSRKAGEGQYLNKDQMAGAFMKKPEATHFMDRAYNVIEDEYYAFAEKNVRIGTWKTYEPIAFQMVKINIAKAQGSRVHLMLHRKSSYLGVMKLVPTHKSASARAEFNILTMSKDCPFIVHLIDGFISSGVNEYNMENNTYYLFLEYAPFRTLDHLTQAINGIGSVSARLYAIEIVCALDFLHQHMILHRDVSPDNILILLSGHVALADLGSALQMGGDTVTNRTCGSYVTRPPEVWNGENYTFAVDVWQFGVTLYDIIANVWPFLHASREKQIQHISSGKVAFNASIFSEPASDLIMSILKVEPSMRPTWSDIIKHKYFEDVKQPYTPPFTPHELQEMYHYGDEEALIKELVLQLK